MRTPARMFAAATLTVLAVLSTGVAQASQAEERGQRVLERRLAREHHGVAAPANPAPAAEPYRSYHDALAAQAQTGQADAEQFRRGERADIPTEPPAQLPAPVQPNEPGGQPAWLVVSLGGLAAALAIIAGLAVLSARRANRRARVGQAA
jgi:hypothetical protein